MSTFKKLGIRKLERRFTGKKVGNWDEILGKTILILDFEIVPSKKRPGTEYLKLQILFDKKKRFISTSSKYLLGIMRQVSLEDVLRDPIKTTILEDRGAIYFKGTLVLDDDEPVLDIKKE